MATPKTPDAAPADAGGHGAPKKRGSKKLIIIAAAAVVVLGGAGGGAFALGLFGKSGAAAAKEAAAPAVPGGIDLPEIVANLNAGPRRTSFVRVKARLELANKNDEPAVNAASAKIRDLFQTYLRDMRPDELRGSAGTYRLREELLARVNIALAPARATDILFVELLVQ